MIILNLEIIYDPAVVMPEGDVVRGNALPQASLFSANTGERGIQITDIARGAALARTLSSHPVALMRGHGNVVVGVDVKVATYRAIYTEMNARLQLQAMMAGGPITYLHKEEALLTEATIEGQIHRPWELWKAKIARKS